MIVSKRLEMNTNKSTDKFVSNFLFFFFRSIDDDQVFKVVNPVPALIRIPKFPFCSTTTKLKRQKEEEEIGERIERERERGEKKEERELRKRMDAFIGILIHRQIIQERNVLFRSIHSINDNPKPRTKIEIVFGLIFDIFCLKKYLFQVI